jgi:hypothetical protein
MISGVEIMNNFFKMKCEVISNICHTPFSPLIFRQKMCGLYMRKYGILNKKSEILKIIHVLYI